MKSGMMQNRKPMAIGFFLVMFAVVIIVFSFAFVVGDQVPYEGFYYEIEGEELGGIGDVDGNGLELVPGPNGHIRAIGVNTLPENFRITSTGQIEWESCDINDYPQTHIRFGLYVAQREVPTGPLADPYVGDGVPLVIGFPGNLNDDYAYNQDTHYGIDIGNAPFIDPNELVNKFTIILEKIDTEIFASYVDPNGIEIAIDTWIVAADIPLNLEFVATDRTDQNSGLVVFGSTIIESSLETPPLKVAGIQQFVLTMNRGEDGCPTVIARDVNSPPIYRSYYLGIRWDPKAISAIDTDGDGVRDAVAVLGTRRGTPHMAVQIKDPFTNTVICPTIYFFDPNSGMNFRDMTVFDYNGDGIEDIAVLARNNDTELVKVKIKDIDGNVLDVYNYMRQ